MQILLVNTNPVISRLISLVTGSANIHIDEITGYEVVPQGRYDILFMDEDCCNEEGIKAFSNKVTARKKILFSSQKEKIVEGIDSVVAKPFLPSEISRVIETLPERPEETFDAGDVVSAGVDENKSDQEIENSILDSAEIEKIKQLLTEEWLEIAENEESDMEPEELMIEEKEQKKKKEPIKKKKEKISRKIKKKEAKFEKNLLEAMRAMKPRKIKKLLKGAEVSISIRFPKGD